MFSISPICFSLNLLANKIYLLFIVIKYVFSMFIYFFIQLKLDLQIKLNYFYFSFKQVGLH